MSKDDVKQIKVGSHTTGIIGLKNVVEEVAKEFAEKQDEEIQAELLKRLSKKNYISDRTRESYGKAFLREFNIFLGKPYDEDDSEGLEIKVLGPGCAQCDRLEMELMEIMTEMNLPADLEHITDIKEIGKYGVMGMPALIVNGKVMCTGKVPTKRKLKEWLSEFV
ncbi:MAG: thioredoxin family protein [Desulfobulbaceae bacterium]|nr:thioredoxin family protein [Desulfobulbaceae bacterium]